MKIAIKEALKKQLTNYMLLEKVFARVVDAAFFAIRICFSLFERCQSMFLGFIPTYHIQFECRNGYTEKR